MSTPPPSRTTTFLSAEWHNLVVVNFPVPQSLLLPYLPSGTELDLWQDKALVSLVAFQFINTRVLGVPIPFHRNFEEINLRFYVRRREGTHVKRGVVFIKELVPRWAIATVARVVYHENYVCVPMTHQVSIQGSERLLNYYWREQHRNNSIQATVTDAPQPLQAGSEAEFILEHYWGYCRVSSTQTIEYEVQHPPWRAWTMPQIVLDADLSATYGADFGAAMAGGWCSAFVAEGSAIKVLSGRGL